MSNKENDNNEQETSEMQFEDFALKTNVLDFATRSKAKAKPQRRTPASSSTKLFQSGKESGLLLSQKIIRQSFTQCEKRMTALLRHGHLPREDDGAIEFWRLKDYLRFDFENSQHWSHEMWKNKMAEGGGVRKRNCLPPSCSRSLRTQSH